MVAVESSLRHASLRNHLVLIVPSRDVYPIGANFAGTFGTSPLRLVDRLSFLLAMFEVQIGYSTSNKCQWCGKCRAQALDSALCRIRTGAYKTFQLAVVLLPGQRLYAVLITPFFCSDDLARSLIL